MQTNAKVLIRNHIPEFEAYSKWSADIDRSIALYMGNKLHEIHSDEFVTRRCVDVIPTLNMKFLLMMIEISVDYSLRRADVDHLSFFEVYCAVTEIDHRLHIMTYV